MVSNLSLIRVSLSFSIQTAKMDVNRGTDPKITPALEVVVFVNPIDKKK